ncbi:hypothetical protein OESDEN_01220 [Oesophagostomum dentatum]|uniref:Glycosyltransferase family 92 protein n=1 Tax=Oesophagostomum dentatum TaxID=61180 RepID=A0A0B1TRQ9_OESDE|nr:hypothetical protein OESDEN_01220 [Oesophagostomum dentatum]
MHCPANGEAKFVAVTLNWDDAVPPSAVHQIGVVQEDKQFFLSVCLAPLWGGSPKWLMLIEFIEYYLLQGAEHFFIYRQTVDALTQTVLDSYTKRGLLEVIDVTEETKCLKKHRCRHEMQLQDCVFRARGRSKWVATVDLDERIAVNSGKTLTEYVRTTGEESRGELRFRCRWVLRLDEIPTSPSSWRSEGAHTPMAVWHNTSHVAPVNHTTKSIIQPEKVCLFVAPHKAAASVTSFQAKVEGMSVHQVLRFSPGADVFLVPSEEAVVRHYRYTQGWAFFLKEAETFGEFEETTVTSTLAKTLENNVHQAVDHLFPEETSS